MIPILLMNLSLLVLNGLRTIDLTDIKPHFQMDFQANRRDLTFLNATSNSLAEVSPSHSFICLREGID